MVSNMVNFQWCELFAGGFAEFCSFAAPDVCKTAKGCQAYIPGDLRGFGFAASGASAILKIRILSRV
jgi:hypothetical protein